MSVISGNDGKLNAVWWRWWCICNRPFNSGFPCWFCGVLWFINAKSLIRSAGILLNIYREVTFKTCTTMYVEYFFIIRRHICRVSCYPVQDLKKIIDKMTGLNIDILMSKYKFLYDVTGINKIVKKTVWLIIFPFNWIWMIAGYNWHTYIVGRI